ncbi:MAG: CoA-binding protein [Spirochaetia bacterium]|nr:CoA-binding protein [Spirochaetia bacterium]
MSSLLRPKSVALVGATEREGSVGRALLSNLASGFQGKIFPVNLKSPSVLGIKAYPSVSEIPEPVDLVVLAIPAVGIPEALEASAKKGTRAALVISAGFRETGEAGRLAEETLIATAAQYDIALVGPNCLGIINTDPDVNLNATFAKRIPRRGNISFLSQSGALGICALEFAASREIGFAHFVSLGNKAVLHENHFLKAFAEDPKTRVILAYLEDFHAPGEFLELAAGIAGGADPKPIVLLKAGRGKSGRRAASSHTGA